MPQTVHAALGCGITKAPILGALQKVPDVADGPEVGVTLPCAPVDNGRNSGETRTQTPHF